nr:amidohydrolase family protein [Sphingomonas sp.]
MIDAHVHLWRIGQNGCTRPTSDMTPIYRDFSLDDVRQVVGPADVGQVILVQSQENQTDTSWLLSLPRDSLIAGVVGWADLLEPDAAATIGRLASNPRLRGLRPMVQDREADWYDMPELDASLAAMTALQLVLDALVRPQHLPALLRLALRHPDLSIIIDHAAKPIISDLSAWSEQIDLLARLPNVACKLSGLLTELPRGAPADAVAPIFDHLWNAFGAERLVWGSDWPVLRLAGDYASWLEQCRQLVPSTHHQAVFDSNARRIYGIQE